MREGPALLSPVVLPPYLPFRALSPPVNYVLYWAHMCELRKGQRPLAGEEPPHPSCSSVLAALVGLTPHQTSPHFVGEAVRRYRPYNRRRATLTASGGSGRMKGPPRPLDVTEAVLVRLRGYSEFSEPSARLKHE